MRSLPLPSDPCVLADLKPAYGYRQIAYQYQSSLVPIVGCAPPVFRFRSQSQTRIGVAPVTPPSHPGIASASKMNIARSNKPASPCTTSQKKRTVAIDCELSSGRRALTTSPTYYS